MSSDNRQSGRNSVNEQEKLQKTVDSTAPGEQRVNQNHNSKKVSLGPNTKR